MKEEIQEVTYVCKDKLNKGVLSFVVAILIALCTSAVFLGIYNHFFRETETSVVEAMPERPQDAFHEVFESISFYDEEEVPLRFENDTISYKGTTYHLTNIKYQGSIFSELATDAERDKPSVVVADTNTHDIAIFYLVKEGTVEGEVYSLTCSLFENVEFSGYTSFPDPVFAEGTLSEACPSWAYERLSTELTDLIRELYPHTTLITYKNSLEIKEDTVSVNFELTSSYKTQSVEVKVQKGDIPLTVTDKGGLW